jgi:HAMP domain-containing protein
LLIGIIVSIYGHRLTSKIKSLTDVAERISIGDLEIEVEAQSRDEIGELAEAISRMQESIRLSIERLRRRR